MSAIASAWSPSRTAAIPDEISGKAVAAASTVAPKITPLTPSRFASSLPLSSRATPAASVTAHPRPKISATRAVDEPAYGCGCCGCRFSARRRPGWLPGILMLQRGSLAARLIP